MGDARIAVDVGGTFTDLVLIHDDIVSIKKVLSTPHDFSRAILDGIRVLLDEAGLACDGLSGIVHATTIGSNTVATGTGARTGLLTTKGFGDLLDIGRMSLPVQNDLTWKKRKPLVERWLRKELDERVGARGEIVRPLDLEQARQATEDLVAAGIESIAVSLVNAYAAPVHEQLLRKMLTDSFPQLYVSVSSDVNPEMFEFERTSTTVIDAYVKPIFARYLELLEEGLAAQSYVRPLFIMQSNGGVTTSTLARLRPSHLIESGPVAGIIGVQKWGQRIGGKNFIAFDMGGTTAKCGIVNDLTLDFTDHLEIDGDRAAGRFLKGSGYLLRTPTVELAEISAGGGSIAWFDEGGALQVGPQSAGADPGPVCYNRGGRQITVTDANVLLGYFNPDYLVGGGLQLDTQRARVVLEDTLAGPLGLTTEKVLLGIRAVANARMAHMVRSVTTQKGRNPVDYTLVAFGGGGPAHAVAIAEELGIETIIVPPGCGLFSAFGLHFADLELHRTWTHWRKVDELDFDHINAWLADVEAETITLLVNQGVNRERIEIHRFVDARYHGQGSELRIPMSGSPLDKETASWLKAEFNRRHLASYGFSTEEPVETFRFGIVTRSVLGIEGMKARLRVSSPLERRFEAHSRRCLFTTVDSWQETHVMQRAQLGETPAEGPLIMEEYDTTVVIPPGWTARLDEWGNIVVRPTG